MIKKRNSDYKSLLLNIYYNADPDDLLPLRERDIELINNSINELAEKESKVIRMHFALGMEFHTLEQIGQQFNLCRERIRQIEKKALRKLRIKKNLNYLFRSLLERMLDEFIKEISRLQTLNEIYKKMITYDKNTTKILVHILDFIEYSKIIKRSISLDPTTDIDDLDISRRVRNWLKRANIKTIGDLVQKREKEILRIKNIGQKSLKEIREFLAQLDLHFEMEIENSFKI